MTSSARITYHIDAATHLVTLTAHGDVTVQDVRDAQDALRDEPQFDADYHQLYDFRASVPADIRSTDVGALLQSSPFSRTSRRAYVTAPGVGFGMARVAETRAELTGRYLRLFEDPDDARAWLLSDDTD